MLITLIILVLSAAFFVAGKVRSDIVALCALIGLLIFQILTPEEALSGFSNSVVIMMVGLFVVGGAIFQTGLAKMISSRILKLAGKSELKLFLLVMLVTSAIGAFVSNTGTVALMLPIVVSLALSAGMNPSRLLMPLAFASSTKQAGVKRIRIHDIRHSHVSLLIDMGFSATAIADRLGHESIEITYNYAHLFPSKQTEMERGR